MTGIYTYLSGAPFSVGSIGNWLYTSSAYSGSRPDAVANCKLYTGVSPEQATTKPWFNAICFTPAPAGVFGNAGRDTIIGPNLWGLDSSLGKNWKVPNISEAFTVQFRAEAFNLLNHPTFQNPGNGAGGSLLTGANVFNNSGGTATLNGSAGLLQATNSSPRQIQLALKIGF